MLENMFLLGREVNGFQIEGEIPGCLRDLTPNMLWDLWDIGLKFGEQTPVGVGFKHQPIIMELCDFRGNDQGGKAGFTVMDLSQRSQEFVDMGWAVTEGGCQFLSLRNGMRVIWHNLCPVAQIPRLIREIDSVADARMWISGGKRIFAPEPAFANQDAYISACIAEMMTRGLLSTN